jgi:hypothetical protein
MDEIQIGVNMPHFILEVELDDPAFCGNCPCAVFDRDGADCCSALDYQELGTEYISTMSGGLYFKLRSKKCPLKEVKVQELKTIAKKDLIDGGYYLGDNMETDRAVWSSKRNCFCRTFAGHFPGDAYITMYSHPEDGNNLDIFEPKFYLGEY